MNAAHLTIDLSASRITWRRLTVEQIDDVRRAAIEAGDKVVASRAARALARR